MSLAIVGEAYGVEEERLGIPFVGPSGALLLQMLDESSLMPLTPQDHFHFRSYWSSGKDSNYLALIWASHEDVFCTNVLNLHPAQNDITTLCVNKSEDETGLPPISPGKYLKKEYLGELERLYSEINKVNPTIIIALGNTACWALFKQTSISKIRGTVRSCEIPNA